MIHKLVMYSLAVVAVALSGCGGGSSTPPADFSITATPATVNLTGGGSPATITVTAAPVNGFTGPVSVAISGLPAGVTASPATLNLTVGTAQTVSLSASQSVAAGSATVSLVASAGTISHTATISVNLTAFTPPPSFSLSVSPQSLALTQGGPGVGATISATGSNGFNSAVTLTLNGLPSGVTASPAQLSVTPGTPLQVTFTASVAAAIGSSTVTISGSSGTLTASTTLMLSVGAQPVPDVTTYHYDNARTGQNLQETALTTGNVNATTFGKVGFFPVDGHVDAEPLYLYQLTIGGAVHNVLYVASEHDTVFAFDADTGTQLWQHSILPAGETTSDPRGCGQIAPEIGITSTPVIDRRQGANGTIFVVGMSKDAAGHYHQRIHALDLTTGADLITTEVTATYPGTGANSSNGNVIFDPGQYAERVGLLLLNGVIYTGWTSHCDIGLYTGWLMGYDQKTLQQSAVLNLTPNGSEGSIWMSGAGLAADSSGNIFFLDANGTFDATLNANSFPAQGDFGNGFLKVSTAAGKLAVADYFEPYNSTSESNVDEDLGSGGALLLPDFTDGTGKVRHLALGAGKDSNIYVVDRDSMGKFNATENSNVYQVLPGALHQEFAMPAYFNNTVYFGGVGNVLQAFSIANAKLVSPPASVSATTFGYPGTTPSVSANGSSNGIVWAIENAGNGVLHAYDATDLSKELYNSTQAPNGRDTAGPDNKFITPMIVNGKVYVETTSGVAVYGLLH